MGENNKEKRENTKKWRGGVKVEWGGEGSNITNTSPRLRLIPMGFFSPVAPRVRNFFSFIQGQFHIDRGILDYFVA